ncbi:MAG TPA: hypothetical protein VGL61_33940 [Kofleriaceae bacterium]
MNEYLLFYKKRIDVKRRTRERWDVLISAYNSSERVKRLHALVDAQEKHWILLPEYKYEQNERPPSNAHVGAGEDEEVVMSAFIDAIGGLAGRRVVVDITGFINSYVIVLLAMLGQRGVTRVDVLYGEPERYLNSERTRFSGEDVLQVRQVFGFEGVHTNDTSKDLLVIAVGYDWKLVSEVAASKEHAKKVQIFGLPSLRPDMYQESLLRSRMVAEALGPEASDPRNFQYAPASDPFVTASVVSAIVRGHRDEYPRANVYLSPLSTKVQALGFALYYLRECQNTATSIIYPLCGTYSRETSEGLASAWQFVVELTSEPSQKDLS